VNRLSGVIAFVESTDDLSLVDVEVDGDLFTAILVETPESAAWRKNGHKVAVLFKETEVSLAKNLSGRISLRNRMAARVESIRKGKLLSEVRLDYRGHAEVSVITTRSVERLELAPGDEVEGLVKANEVTLLEDEHDA
jgi:molybdate transport system regulatory protein